MSKTNFTEEFKRDAVRQITERGYPVAEVSQRLGVSQHSLYEWKKKFAASNAKPFYWTRSRLHSIQNLSQRSSIFFVIWQGRE